MVKELEKTLVNFPGEASRTHCFCHIINLVAKSVITQFDVPNDANLAGQMEVEEARQQLEDKQENKDTDDDKGWVDERAEMSAVELVVLDCDVFPARRVLTKVGPC